MVAFLLGTGMAPRKFEYGHTSVRIHLLPFVLVGSSPTKSMPIVGEKDTKTVVVHACVLGVG